MSAPPVIEPMPSLSAGLLAGRALFAAVVALAGLLALWELWLAPIRPGGSWLALKALPLCAALPGLVRRNPRTAQWLTLLLPLYVAEGVVRAWSEPGRVRAFASAEIVLALVAFVAAIALVRLVRLRQAAPPGR